MSLKVIVQFSFAYSIGTIAILLLVYWLVVISYRLYLIRNKHKQYLSTYGLDPRVHSQILYSLATVRNRDICLVVLILLEILILAIFSYAMLEIFLTLSNLEDKRKEIFPNCNYTDSTIINLYVYPVYALLVVALSILVIIQMMLLSILNSYLAGRYFGHSFPKIVVCKYIFSWIFQTSILTICVMPNFQIFILPIYSLLLFLNWLNIIASSRKMCRAIQSKMKEIRLFEWNPAQYRNHSLNLQQYRTAMGFLISAFLFLTLASGFYSINYFFIVGSCFINTVYELNLNFDVSNLFHNYISTLLTWFAYFFILLFAILLLLPSLSIFLYHMVNLLYGRYTGKGKYHSALFEPLISH